MVFFRIEVIGYAERSNDLVFTTITLTDIATIIEVTCVLLGKLLVDLACRFT